MGKCRSEQIPVTDLLPDAGEPTGLAAFVHRLRDPIDTRIPSNLNQVFNVV